MLYRLIELSIGYWFIHPLNNLGQISKLIRSVINVDSHRPLIGRYLSVYRMERSCEALASFIHRSMRFLFLYKKEFFHSYFFEAWWLVLSSEPRNKHKQPTTHNDVK